jgi:hypothetical protein
MKVESNVAEGQYSMTETWLTFYRSLNRWQKTVATVRFALKGVWHDTCYLVTEESLIDTVGDLTPFITATHL